MKLINLDAFRTQPGVGGHVELYKDDVSEWRWRRVAGNGQIVAQHEGYDERNDCLEMAVRLWGRTLPYYEVEA